MASSASASAPTRTLRTAATVGRRRIKISVKMMPPIASIKPITVQISLPASFNSETEKNCNVDDNKYIICSLMLQIGILMGIRPLPCTPSIFKSSLFHDLYLKWTLHFEGKLPIISQLSEINDGDNLILFCGDNWKKSSDAIDNGEVNLLDLVPTKFNIFSVSLVSKDCDDNEDSKCNISERKSPAATEVIDLVDCSSSSSSDESSATIDNNGDEVDWNADVCSISSDDSSDIEDVTEVYLAKRNEELRQMINDAEEVDDSDDTDAEVDQGTTGKKRKRQSHRSPSCLIEILIDEKDMPICPGVTVDQDPDRDISHDKNTTRTIKQRIVKLLNTGFHGESNEHEARNAMKLARRLMERYNLDQAVLLQERGDGSLNDFSTTNNDDDGSALQGAMVTVKIVNKKSRKPLSALPRWLNYLIGTVSLNFHVDAFKSVNKGKPTSLGECSVTFYGLRVNVQLAAYAYKIAGERCSQMASAYHDEPPSKKILPTRNLAAITRTARLSYALGIVNGLHRDVKESLRKEEERRTKKLRRAQQRAAKGDACDSDDDSIGVEGADNDEHELEIEQSKGKTRLDHLERENNAHLALIDHHRKIAADVLKSNNIKIQTAKKTKSIALNQRAYDKGVIDSKEIDLNQQAIK